MSSAHEPKVSVVVSCYNYARYLPEAVASALAQTYRNVEVIIVDDGSTDETPAVAARLASDPRVVSVRQANQGQAAAKNTGIKKATGPYVAFLDADDRWQPSKLEKQMPLFDDPTVGIVFSRMKPVDADGRPLAGRDTAPERQPQRGRVSEALFLDNFVPFSSAVVHRAVFEKVGAMDTSISMGIDWDLWLRASVHYTFDFVDEELIEYRVGHSGQMSRRQEERHGWAEKIMAKFVRENPDALPPAAIRRAWSYTYNSRGYYYRHRDLPRSTSFYFRALSTQPFQAAAYRGLVMNGWTAFSGLWKKSRPASTVV